MVRSKLLKDKIKSDIANLLGIQDHTPNSKITGLIEGLVNDLDNFEQNELATLSNMYVDTCDSTYLDRIAAQEGLSRTRNSIFKFPSGSEVFSITSENNISYERGSYFDLDKNLTFVLDDAINIIPNNTYYVSGQIRVNDTTEYLNINKGDVFNLNNGVYLTINEPLYAPIIEEELEDFRMRVLFAQSSSKFGSENAIRSCIASSSLVTSYRVDYDTNPITIYIFNKNALTEPDVLLELLTYSKNIIETELNKKKADGTFYKVTVPNKNSFKIVFESRADVPRPIPNIIYGLVDLIKDTYQLGNEYTYNINTIRNYLEGRNIDLDFLEDYTISFKKTYINFDVLSENNEIKVYSNEYPFLDSIEIT